MAAATALKLGDIVQGHTYMGGDPNAQSSWVDVDALDGTGLSGQPFLDQIQKQHPSLVNSIKALSEGRQATPMNRVMVDPYWGTAFKLAQQYDPTLDQTTYPVRQKTAIDFKAGGTAAQNLRNLNQAIGHLHELTQAIPAVAGHSGLLGLSHIINMGQNAEANFSGDPNYTAYTIPQTALASELASVFKGKGTTAEPEVNKYYDALGINASTPQKYQAARSLAGLLKSRVDELSDQFQQGMSKTPDQLRLLNPQAQKDFDDAQSKYNSIIKSAGGAEPDNDPAAAIAPTMDAATMSLLKKYNIGGASGSP